MVLGSVSETRDSNSRNCTGGCPYGGVECLATVMSCTGIGVQTASSAEISNCNVSASP